MAPTPETKRATPFILWGSGLVFVLVAVIAVRSLTREHVSVRTAKASYQDLIKSSSTNGKVEPIEDFQAHSQTAGVVEKIYVNVGDRVKNGQLLLSMDDADATARLASAQSSLQAARLSEGDIQHGGTQDERNTYAADMARAKSQVESDRAMLSARQQLQQKGAASAAEVNDAQQRLDADEASLRSVEQHSTQRYGEADRATARAKIADAQASVAVAQSSFSGANIRSKLTGSVYFVAVAQYDSVNAGDELINVADLNRIRVRAYFDEPEVGNLAVGQPVKIVWDAKPGMVWHGHITIAPTTIITYGTRNVGEAFITVDDARGDLLPNTNVTVTVTISQRLHVLSVPREAIHTDSGQTYVYRINDGKLIRTPVQVGIFNLTREEILSGLSDGEVVVLGATTNRDLNSGLQVTAVQ